MAKDFIRKSIKFISKGIQISRATSLMDEGKYLELNNVRSYQGGVIRQRPGLHELTPTPAADAPIHSIKRVNDDISGASQTVTAILGAGTKVYSTNSTFTTMTSRDSGYSGKYLSMVTHRPNSSPEPWVYIGDGSRMRKINIAGTNYPIGIAPPTAAPSAAISIPIRKVIDDFDTAASWTQSGTAGAPAAVADNRVNTTITAIKYDTGTTGWANVVPAAMTADIQPGLRLTFGAAAETAVVEKVFNAVTDSTIGSITYDSGTSGLCTIQLAAPFPTGIQLNQLLYNSTQTEYFRVLSITNGPDGLISFRTSTTATFAATNTIQGPANFRVYLTGTRAAADALKATYMTSNVTSGLGYLSQTITLDLAVSASSGRPFADDDIIHCSIRVSDLTKLTEGRLMFDVDGATNDFTKNYYYFPFRANDLTGAIANLQTSLAAEQIVLQRELDALRERERNLLETTKLTYYHPPGFLIDWKGALILNVMNEGLDTDPGGLEKYGHGYGGDPTLAGNPTGGSSIGSQTASGVSQWSEITFKVKDLIRVGADTSKSLKDVKAIRVQVNVTGTIDLDMDSWWIAGSYGPEALEFPINYRYRYRSSATGAVSNPSPPMRTPIEPKREQVAISGLTASSDTQADYLDLYRIGGTLLDWTYVGTIPSGTTTFSDYYLDAELLSNPILEFDNYQPFPVLDIPRTGVCSVTGTKVTRVSGDNFNTAWAPGSIIVIDGVANALYSSPTSTSALEVFNNVGTKTNVTFSLPSPTLLGQALPILFGPYGGGETGIFMFGLGSPQQPGTLFWTKGNNPDSAPDINQLEITSPSEQLMTGCIYDGRAYVFTSERMYFINRNFGGLTDFIAQEVAGSKGALSSWGIAVGDKIYFVSKDGIYETDGGIPISITDDSLYNLFTHDAGSGTFVTSELSGITQLDLSNLDSIKLSYFNSYLYFTYVSSGTYYTLIYDTKNKAWMREVSSPTITCYQPQEGKGTYALLCGSIDARLFDFSSSLDDAGTNFTAKVITRFEDMGDSRIQKFFRDIMIDINCASANVTAKVYVDNNTASPVQTTTIAGGASRTQVILDLNSGDGYLAKTIALELSWSNAAVRLYEWAPSWLEKSEKIESRFTDWTDCGIAGDKRVTGFIVDADTYNASKSIQLQQDGGSVVQTYSFTHNGQKRSTFAVTTPVIAKLLRVSPTDEVPWYLEDLEWLVEPYPENITVTPDFDDLGSSIKAKRINGFIIEADTSGSNSTLTVYKNGNLSSAITTQVINHNGRITATYELSPFYANTVRLTSSAAMRLFKLEWLYEEVPEFSGLNPDFDDLGHKGSKYIYGIVIEADSTESSAGNATFTIKQDGNDVTTVQTLTNLTFSGRSEQEHELTPFIAKTVKLLPSEDVRVFGVRWLFDPIPEYATLIPNLSDLGYKGAKRINGIVIDADTSSNLVTVQIENETGAYVTNISVTHSGRTAKTYEFYPPFTAQLVRLVPDIDWRLYGVRWLFDPVPEYAALNPDFDDLGFKGDKRIYGVVIEADTTPSVTPINFFVLKNGDDGSTVQTLSNLQFNGRSEQAHELTPFTAATVKIVPSNDARVFGVRWLFDPVPENAALQPQFSDDGDPRPKWLQGFELDADTGGNNVTLTIKGDGDATLEAFTANHNGRVIIPYSFTPSSGQLPITHMMRIVPSADMRIWKVRWIWTLDAELATSWITPPMTMQLGRYLHSPAGFLHLRDGYIAHRSTADITFIINVDGTDTTLTIPHSSGIFRRTYMVLPALKGKTFQFRLTSSVAFRLYGEDSEVRAKVWGAEAYQTYNPFGIERTWEHSGTGAEI